MKMNYNWTWLDCLNFWILQWFFIRLIKYKVITDFKLNNVSILNTNKRSIGIEGSIKKIKWKYKIIGFIFPFYEWRNKK